MDINGIRFWCYNAGHVLGAAMFMIEIAGVKVGRHCYDDALYVISLHGNVIQCLL